MRLPVLTRMCMIERAAIGSIVAPTIAVQNSTQRKEKTTTYKQTWKKFTHLGVISH